MPCPGPDCEIWAKHPYCGQTPPPGFIRISSVGLRTHIEANFSQFSTVLLAFDKKVCFIWGMFLTSRSTNEWRLYFVRWSIPWIYKYLGVYIYIGRCVFNMARSLTLSEELVVSFCQTYTCIKQTLDGNVAYTRKTQSIFLSFFISTANTIYITN